MPIMHAYDNTIMHYYDDTIMHNHNYYAYYYDNKDYDNMFMTIMHCYATTIMIICILLWLL